MGDCVCVCVCVCMYLCMYMGPGRRAVCRDMPAVFSSSRTCACPSPHAAWRHHYGSPSGTGSDLQGVEQSDGTYVDLKGGRGISLIIPDELGLLCRRATLRPAPPV